MGLIPGIRVSLSTFPSLPAHMSDPLLAVSTVICRQAAMTAGFEVCMGDFMRCRK